ncbi:MAG: hypothetical protein JWS12_495 [Candidatus Saccharibacteria bacterium]|nr:hypothetical protein [Candidatus Saccharibacteria bacterium]
MVSFPTGFTERAVTIEGNIGQRGDAALVRLQEKGFTVVTGLTEYFAGAVGVMGYQGHIREYCPKDSTESRFGTLQSTEKWLQKGGGRGMFLLLRGEGNNTQLEGYGWTGVEPCEELPDHPITSAYRVGERGKGQGLGKDFVQVVVSGTNTLYAPGEGVGLETWRSNHAANLYPRVGFVPLSEAAEDELRPSLQQDAVDGKVLDRRLYMGYPSDLLG